MGTTSLPKDMATESHRGTATTTVDQTSTGSAADVAVVGQLVPQQHDHQSITTSMPLRSESSSHVHISGSEHTSPQSTPWAGVSVSALVPGDVVLVHRPTGGPARHTGISVQEWVLEQ